MILIVEGPDGAGKTTFAKQFVGAKYRHEGPPPDGMDPLAHYLAQLAAAATFGGDHVFDRMALSECVYGPLLRGKSEISTTGLAFFENHLRSLGAATIICLPPYDVCRSMFEKKLAAGKELLTRIEDFDRAYSHFGDLAASGHGVIYDWTVKS